MSSRSVILAGGCSLAFGAAFANIGVVLHTGTSVSHLTGDSVRITVDLFDSSPLAAGDLLRVTLALLSFFLGAAFSGFIIHHPGLNFTRPYGRTVIAIGAILLLASWSLPKDPTMGIALASFGCGLQNALASRYRGITLRTTHLTGLVTDLGIGTGMRLRGFKIPGWQLLVPTVLILSFFLGGVFGAGVFVFTPHDPVFVSGAAYCLAGIGWTIRKRWPRRA